jgi:hypothetical protein
MNEQIAGGGRQIKLFLVDGSPAGIITAEIVMWTGKAVRAALPSGPAYQFTCFSVQTPIARRD